MSTIFISYAREDQPRAELLTRALTGDGLDVWWDGRIQPGDPSFHRAIEDALRRARCVLVLWSASSVRSEYVEIEASFAWKERKLIPILIDDIAEHIPVAFQLVQAVNLTHWTGDAADEAFVRLEEVITRHLASRPGTLLDKIRKLPQAIGVRLEKTYRLFDQWDGVACIALAVGALAGWSLIGRAAFNGAERWLWGTAALFLLVAWFIVRALARPRWSTGHARVVHVTLSTVMLLAVSSGWVFAATRLYRIPAVRNDRLGVYVARMVNDPNNERQAMLVDSLSQRIVDEAIDRVIVLPIPRRIRFDPRDPARGDARARELGRSGGAVLVLWGSVSHGHDGTAELVGRLTPVDVAGVFERPGLVARDAPTLAEDLATIDVHNELSTVQRVLPSFIAGYALYHDREYPRVLEYMKWVVNHLEHDSTASPDDKRRLSEAILASAHFYLGNTYVMIESPDTAKQHYTAAITHSLHPHEKARPQFLPPLNNLGMLLLTEGDVDGAIRQFAQADVECRTDTTNRFCAYVWYNLGNAFTDADRFADAHSRYVAAAQRIAGNGAAPRDTAAARLLGYVRRGMAYSDVRLAETTEHRAEREALYRKAGSELAAGEEAIRGVGDGVPPAFHITRARVYVGLGEWEAAAAQLDSAADSLPTHPDIALLTAVVQSCTGHMIQSAQSLDRYRALAGLAYPKGMLELRDLIRACREGQ